MFGVGGGYVFQLHIDGWLSKLLQHAPTENLLPSMVLSLAQMHLTPTVYSSTGQLATTGSTEPQSKVRVHFLNTMSFTALETEVVGKYNPSIAEVRQGHLAHVLPYLGFVPSCDIAVRPCFK